MTQEINWLQRLPKPVLCKILADCPVEAFKVCKLFNKLVPGALLLFKWNPLIKHKDLPLDLKDRLEKIENSFPKSDRENPCKLIDAFFCSLHNSKKNNPITNLGFCHFGNAMLSAWRAEQDFHLVQLWFQIRLKLRVNYLYSDEVTNGTDEILWNKWKVGAFPTYKKIGEVYLHILTENLEKDVEARLAAIPVRIRHWMGKEKKKKLLDISDLVLKSLSLKMLPSEIFILKHTLVKLNLCNNAFTQLPVGIEHLYRLNALNISNNDLYELPDTIGKLCFLQTLNVSQNQLEKLSDALGKLVNLVDLYLLGNKLETLPNAIKYLLALEELNLSKNKFKELPAIIKSLANLKELDLSSNEIEMLPEDIGDYSGLVHLNLSGNKIKQLPDTIGDLDGLESLNLSNNLLTVLPMAFAGIGEIAGDETKINLSRNLLLVIPTLVLEKFKQDSTIQEFIDLRDEECYSPLDKLCQLIRNNSDAILIKKFVEKEALEKLVDALDQSDRMRLYINILEIPKTEEDNDSVDEDDRDIEWVKMNRFNDMLRFVYALGELLYLRREEKEKK